MPPTTRSTARILKNHPGIPRPLLIPDILSEIFLWSLPNSTPVITSLSTIASQPPVNVSQVCRLWRDVSLQTRQLWSRWYFSFGPPNPTSTVMVSKLVILLTNWLQRSRDSPLDLCMRFGYRRSDDDLRILRFLYQHRSRWGRVLEMPTLSRHKSRMVLRPIDVPVLQELHLQGELDPFCFQKGLLDHQRTQQQLSVPTFANLRKVTLEMREHDNDAYACMSLLACSPLLEDVEVSIGVDMEDLLHVPRAVTLPLPNLRCLILHVSGNCTFLESILKGLVAPSLQTLYLSGPISCHRYPELVVGLLTQCSANLTTLSLCIASNDEQTVNCLNAAPKVNLLCLYGSRNTEQLLVALRAASDGIFDLCPALSACSIVRFGGRRHPRTLARWQDRACAFDLTRLEDCPELYPIDDAQEYREWDTLLLSQSDELAPAFSILWE